MELGARYIYNIKISKVIELQRAEIWLGRRPVDIPIVAK